MLSSQLKRSFTPEQVEAVLSALGSDTPHVTTTGDYIFNTVCHNPPHQGSYKLYYYQNSGRFQCFTACGTMDIYDLIQHSRHCSFYEAVLFLRSILGLTEERRLGFAPGGCKEDWDILNRYAQAGTAFSHENPPAYQSLPPTLLDYYTPIFPLEWSKEYITPEVCAQYHIHFDVAANAIIIPHYSMEGHLIGIRSRSLDKETVAAGFKYMPAQLEGKDFRHTLRYNLYGLCQNEAAIRRHKKVMLVEGEKSVLQCAAYYGDNSYALAVCGSNISNYQRDMILSLGVQEVQLAFDKEYHQPYTPQSDSYSEKLLKLASIFTPYMRTCILWDGGELLEYKDSPTDKGKLVLEELLSNKYEVTTKE